MVDKKRELAIEIIDEFENLLEEKNITIPSKDREGNEEEGRIYGEEYYSLEDGITDKLSVIRDKLIDLFKDDINKQIIQNYFDKEI